MVIFQSHGLSGYISVSGYHLIVYTGYISVWISFNSLYWLYFSLRILFYAMNAMRDTRVYRSGKDTLSVLKKKLLSSPYVLEFKVVSIDTLGK